LTEKIFWISNYTYPADIKPIRIPTSRNCYTITFPALRVAATSNTQSIELLIIEIDFVAMLP
jgi:hypothetical protein